MSINTTPFLHLPQWTASEQPSYLGEMNQAYSAIDTGYGEIKTLAQTGVTGSQAAVATADAAKEQSQANAAAITTLQQSVASLESDFIDASHIKTLNLTYDNVYDGFEITSAFTHYNRYCAHFFISIRNNNWANFFKTHITSSTAVCKLTNIPYIYKTISLYGGFSFSINVTSSLGHWGDAMSVYISQAGNLMLGGGDASITGNSNTLMSLTATLPIFRQSTAKIRTSEMLDNCLYIAD